MKTIFEIFKENFSELEKYKYLIISFDSLNEKDFLNGLIEFFNYDNKKFARIIVEKDFLTVSFLINDKNLNLVQKSKYFELIKKTCVKVTNKIIEL